jgi:predicted DNA-binding protein with PD1-like motif
MKTHLLSSGAFLVLERGDEVLATLGRFVADRGWKACTFSGIGALRDVEVGFFDITQRTYDRRTFPEVELLSLTGNASRLEDGSVAIHLHAVLGTEAFGAVGGHLFSGIVSVTAEIHATALEADLVRRVDPVSGLKLLG